MSTNCFKGVTRYHAEGGQFAATDHEQVVLIPDGMLAGFFRRVRLTCVNDGTKAGIGVICQPFSLRKLHGQKSLVYGLRLPIMKLESASRFAKNNS
jgi:hypothetical protein